MPGVYAVRGAGCSGRRFQARCAGLPATRMTLRSSLPLAALILASCTWTSGVPASLPTASRTFTHEQGFSLLVPEKAQEERIVPDGVIVSQGTFRGAAPVDGALTSYALRYALYEPNPLYSLDALAANPKGTCINDESCTFLKETRSTRGALTIVSQMWPQTDPGALHVVLVGRGGRVLKFSWSDPDSSGILTTLCEAMVNSVMLEAQGTSSNAAPASSAPAPAEA